MTVVGVRFKEVGKIYYFDPDGRDIPKDTPVIVETVRGVEYGHAVLSNREVEDESIVPPLKKIIRLATAEDAAQEENNRKKEKEAFGICQEKIKNHGLDMHLVSVELTFDLNKIIFYFTADGRVDFRELVKDLAAVFRTRIELRQIGVRDEAKILNGIGICGRELCCASFLDEFQPVSIKMAKEQSMALNPTKISGICGRLMCCLKYEEETYEFLNQNLPGVGDLVRTPDGDGDVISVNVLRQLARVAVRKRKQDDPTLSVYAIEEITILEHRPQPEEEFEERPRRHRRGTQAANAPETAQ
ncbi:MAG: stage 0 sporulation family protein [Clostridiales bacterium]|jgi:cell fate regulator YaaT (PSP1 superfamily)|nr:stage 0 sporulation family protein [Clostridiales bacterium]